MSWEKAAVSFYCWLLSKNEGKRPVRIENTSEEIRADAGPDTCAGGMLAEVVDWLGYREGGRCLLWRQRGKGRC